MLSSCAGGVEGHGQIPLKTEEKEGVLVEVCITGLRGGHSGVEIGNFCMNADIVFARVLNDIIGGSKDNIIPNEVVSKLCVNKNDIKAFYEELCIQYKILKDEYFAYEKDMEFFVNIDNKERKNICDKKLF